MKTTRRFSPSFIQLTLVLAAAAGLARVAAAETVVGSGHVVSETRRVTGFSGVDLRGSGDVIITQGDTEGLVIDAEDNLLPLIESTVGADGVLRLGFKPHSGSIESKKEVVYKLAVRNLDRLMVEGSGSIRAASLSADALSLTLPGSGEIGVDQLKAASVKVGVMGSGVVKLAGEAPSESVTIDGSGTCETQKLQAGEVEVAINGSGEGRVWAENSLKVTINGSGAVDYRGKPKVTEHINGSGEVNALGTKDE